MNSKSIRSLIESLIKSYKDKDREYQDWKRNAYAGKNNAASANKANMVLLERKINSIKKQIYGELNKPAYIVKLRVNGKPETGFLTNIEKEDIPYLYHVYALTLRYEIEILEIKEIHPSILGD